MRRDLPRESRSWIYDHITRPVRPDDWEAYTGLEAGQTYADIPERLQRYRTDIFTDKYKRLSWEELSRTITAHIAKDGYWYIHPEQHRTLSIREAARLQTFPDWFRFAGQPSHRYEQIGNAVPPLVAEAVGLALRGALSGTARRVAAVGETRARLLSWHSKQPVHPWRRVGVMPWLVLAAELALDRSTTDTLAERFAKLIDIAPTPSALLAKPDPARSLTAIGLSSHAGRAVVAAAHTIMDTFEGEVPMADLELRAIPGVGDSLAKTVLCFGYGRVSVPLHSAAERVASRVAGRSEARRWQLRLDLHKLAQPVGPDAQFNAAVLHLGTTVCRTVDPLCGECPINEKCFTGRGAVVMRHGAER